VVFRLVQGQNESAGEAREEFATNYAPAMVGEMIAAQAATYPDQGSWKGVLVLSRQRNQSIE
jgi:hypothetical protein